MLTPNILENVYLILPIRFNLSLFVVWLCLFNVSLSNQNMVIKIDLFLLNAKYAKQTIVTQTERRQ